MKVGYWRRGAALALGLLVLSGCSGSDQEGYRTVRPDTGPVEYRVEDTGTVTYADNYTIVPTVSGTVTECTFQEGDSVTAGQTLYTIDSDALEDQIVQAQLSVDSAQVALEQTVASLAQAKVMHDELEKLYNPHVDFGRVYEKAEKIISSLTAQM